MNDLYKKFVEDLCKALTKLNKAIVFVAERTLSAKEFIEFTEEFTEETDHKDTDSLFSREWDGA